MALIAAIHRHNRNCATDVFFLLKKKLKPCTNHYCVIWAMSPWNYTNHYCATVIIILQLNLPALYAETIELIPTRKWQRVMWGENGFRHVVVLQETLRQCCQYYKAPSELVLVQNVQCMNKGLLICSRLPTTLLRTCLTACTRASRKPWYFVLIYFDELQSYL